MSEQSCEDALRNAAARLQPVLEPIGFEFRRDQAGIGHGPFASGFFVSGDLKIGLIYRDDSRLGCVIYENATSNISHDDFMQAAGYAQQQRLHYRKRVSVASGEGDPIDALSADLNLVAAFLQDHVQMARFIEQATKVRAEKLGVRTDLSAPPAETSPRQLQVRRWGHYLLLLVAVVFTGEAILFLTTALQHKLSATGVRFLMLAVSVFLTTATALYGFARVVQKPVTLLLGLLLLQPAVSSASSFLQTGKLADSVGVATVAAVVGVLLIASVVNAERAQRS